MSAAAEKSMTGALIDITNSLPTYFIIRGTWNDWRAGFQLAARSAEYASDLISLGYCLQALANVERTPATALGAHWSSAATSVSVRLRISKGRPAS